MSDSLANTLNFLSQQRQIPAASPEFLASAQNPNIRMQSPNAQSSFTHPLLQKLYNAPGAAAKGIGGGISSLANFLGLQAVKPEMAIRENVDDNFITRANQRTVDAIAAQTR